MVRGSSSGGSRSYGGAPAVWGRFALESNRFFSSLSWGIFVWKNFRTYCAECCLFFLTGSHLSLKNAIYQLVRSLRGVRRRVETQKVMLWVF